MNRLLVLLIVIAIVGAATIALLASPHNHSKEATTPVTGTLSASFSIGPTQTTCSVSGTEGPAPKSYSSIKAVVSSSGVALTLPVDWVSNGCDVTGSVAPSLSPGSYSLNLSGCTFAGCKSALPRSLEISAGNTTVVSIVVSTDAA